MNNNYLHSIRDFELKQALCLFPTPSHGKGRIRVLDFGAGTGHQSSQLHQLGYEVLAVDLPSSAYAHERVYPVINYDGSILPFPDATVDLVFSSNALEHVVDIRGILNEIRRVLVPGGIAIHILPTPTWRLWTLLAYYPWVLKRIVQRMQGKHFLSSNIPGQRSPSNFFRFLHSNAWPSRHGERGSALTECWYYSERWWRNTFSTSGFEVIETRPNRLFYTGNMLLEGHLTIKSRHNLSEWFGSSCRIFVLAVAGDTDQPL